MGTIQPGEPNLRTIIAFKDVNTVIVNVEKHILTDKNQRAWDNLEILPEF